VKALIAEDEMVQADSIKRALQKEGFDREPFQVVDIVGDGMIARQRIANGYDLIILDVKMPNMDGIQVVAEVNKLDPALRPIVVLVTAFPGDYETAELAVKMGVQAIFIKPIRLPALTDEIRRLLRIRRQMAEALQHGPPIDCRWELVLSQEGAAFVKVRGLMNLVDCCHMPLRRWDEWVASDEAELTDMLLQLPGSLRHVRDRWIAQAKDTGTKLYERLFVDCIERSLTQAGALVSPDSRRLKLSFAGPRDSLATPFELLHDKEYYLILKHPFKRSITGLPTKGSTSFVGLARQLAVRGEPVRILLVASNTLPPLAAVDNEIVALHKHLSANLPPDKFQIDCLSTDQATYHEIVQRLKHCYYHMIHYAGHGLHNRQNPGQSSLFFWEGPGRTGEVKSLTADGLSATLRTGGGCAELQFVYLSCCYGGSTSPATTLLRENFLGMADSLVASGVPAVLGYRWAVSDMGAEKMALAFYDSLFEQGEYDVALFEARCAVAGDEEGTAAGDWLSPILIVQG
jgi:DNA-binding response OmpR family regulator